ncbi:MAG TPA: GNAT family N-acetyltransferase [Anaerolineales bacterium]|nr:GNAT family N-acetyltransferase [Anaerolineales bacterium]
MSSITIPIKANDHPHIRPLNVLRDLSAVADLIELCFSPTMDHDGQRYLSDMRRASRDDSFLRWASRVTETATLPLMGYVWEENGRIIGNASLIPFRHKGQRIYLIANVAAHPDHRRRGVGRTLTEQVMKQARDRRASEIWLHVREDNPGAIRLYEQLGFREMARRTTWQAGPDARLNYPDAGIEIVPRHPQLWPQQQKWLQRVYPDSLKWYQGWNLNAFRPGILNWMYLLMIDSSIKQWAAVQKDELLATLTWMPQGGRSESLYAAVGEGSDPDALTLLLIQARRAVTYYPQLTLEYPANEMTQAIRAAGFQALRTLLWMRA